MKILFCKISCMKYYRGANEQDKPFNGGSFVDKNGYGHEQYNFDSVRLDDEDVCLGFVETKSTNKVKQNELHIENISGCESMKEEESVDGILVIWCATTELNDPSIVGWYKDATVYRNYLEAEFDMGYIQPYNIIASKENCCLLPQGIRRRRTLWSAPIARERGYGFGSSLIWYALEDEAQAYVKKIIKNIEEYDGENWVNLILEP